MAVRFYGIDKTENFLDSLHNQEKYSLFAILIAASLISSNMLIYFSKIPPGIINQDHNFKIITKDENLETSQLLKITSHIYSNIYQHLSTELKGQVPQEKIAAFAQELSIVVESKLQEQAFIAVNNAVSLKISDELIIELNKIIEQEIAKKILIWKNQGYLIRDAVIVTGAGTGVLFTGRLTWCSISEQNCQAE